MSQTLTVVVHGTFASEAHWWRLGSGGEATFADRLEVELSQRGLSGTVWKPALAEGLQYSSFTWSGRNRHRDRVKGAHGLSSSLNDLAQKMSATPSEPLTVNFVAHSHGGNVVLEALRHLKPNVRVGRVALLGTPLVTSRPAFRIARFIFSTILLTLFVLGLMLLLINLGFLLFTGSFFEADRIIEKEGQFVKEVATGSDTLTILFPALLLYGWFFWLFGNFLDVAWRILCRLFLPFVWLRGRASTLVYGPSPHVLAQRLDGKPILLLATHNDEADLLLQIGSAPARLYKEYVAAEFSPVGRLLEFLLVRPFVLGVFLKATEMLLEVISLGFSVWRSLLNDFEIASLDERPYYPSHLLVHQKIDIRPEAGSAIVMLGAEATQDRRLGNTTGQRSGLHISLGEVTEEIKRQIQLRHSTYYENRAVIQRVAEFLVGGEEKFVGETRRSTSLKPSPDFWEVLLVGNIALAVLYFWIAGARLPHPIMPYVVASLGYVIPFAALGIIVVLYGAVRRHWPPRLWRWFWIIWAAWAFLCLVSALGTLLRP